MGSYEDLGDVSAMEMTSSRPHTDAPKPSLTTLREEALRRSSSKSSRGSRLVRQASVLETQVDSSGMMKLTYWF